MVLAMSRVEFGDVRRFETLVSTNSYLLEQARGGASEGVVAVADYQTGGRGRLGRRWEAPPGTCLLASILLRPVLASDQLHLCTAVLALAAADACEQVAGVVPAVKWPNDLLVGGRKLAGVLAESDSGAPGGSQGSVAVVVGIGCNVDWAGPKGAGGTSLREAAGQPVDREALLWALLDVFGPRYRSLDSPGGREALAGELRARCETLGRVVRVDLAGGSITGTAVELTGSGHLVVETETGRHEVAAGDAVHLRPADTPFSVPPGAPGGAK
jgi:BirA family transcriptional regulator, biotin operon repressor / biotin---[acetyl-CoA-carboxylase] ligase